MLGEIKMTNEEAEQLIAEIREWISNDGLDPDDVEKIINSFVDKEEEPQLLKDLRRMHKELQTLTRCFNESTMGAYNLDK